MDPILDTRVLVLDQPLGVVALHRDRLADLTLFVLVLVLLREHSVCRV